MLSVLYLEINTVGIVLLLVIFYNQRQEIGSSAKQRRFTTLIFAALVMMILDSACWLVDGKQFPFARTVNYVVETLYFGFHLLLPYLWLIYTEYALNTNEVVIKRRTRIFTILLAVFLAGLLLNLRYELVFRIDENNVYHRAAGVLVYAAYAYALLLYASIRTLLKARYAEWVDDRRRYHNMAFFAVPPMIGGIVQLLYYGVNFSWFLVTISILQVYIDAQNRQISADPLTGLNNRRELGKYLLRETRERDPARNGSLMLFMLDIDGFKQINDTCGHFYGDEVLIRVADVLKLSCKNSNAFLSRYGGDEFCIVLPPEHGRDAYDFMFRIQTNLTDWNNMHREGKPISLSIGYANWEPQRDRDYESLIRRADQMMYEVKNAKKCVKS